MIPDYNNPIIRNKLFFIGELEQRKSITRNVYFILCKALIKANEN